VDPVGIDEPAPRLSWELVNESPERGQVQSASHLLVASSLALLEKNQGDLWDTELPGPATAQIAYAGRPLAPHAQAFWKVQIVDGEGRRSSWSPVARWSMGLMKTEAWRADWIGLDSVKASGAAWLPPAQKDRIYVPATELRKDFSLAGSPSRAVLYVTALGNVEPRLNGRRIADEFFTPGWTDYTKRLYYRAYDVTTLLKPGANTIGALLADGWFRGNIGPFGQNRYGKHTRLRAELHVFGADGKDQVVATDATWKANTGPILEADQHAGESYDARLEQPGWDAPGFDDKHWEAVVTGAEFPPAIIRSHPAPPVRRIAERPVFQLNEPKPGVYVFDLGQNFAGFARLKVNEPTGTVVRLRFAEMLNADGTIYLENLRTARVIDTYVCKGGGEETWEPRFTFHGFRYVEVTGLTKPPPAATITGIVLSTGNTDTGAFESSSALLNQIWSNTRWSQYSNYLEVPTDCPQRDERLGWTGDAQVFVRTGAYNQDIAAFMSKWVDDLVDTQSADGAFNDTAPIGFKGSAAGWADAGIIIPWTLWRVYGDTRVLERHYDAMRRYLEHVRSESPDLIGPSRGYGDWLAIGGVTERKLISTAYFAHDASLMAEMASAIGKTDDAAGFRRLFEDVRSAFQKKFINADGSVGAQKSQTAHLLALRFELLSTEQKFAALPHLVKNLDDRNWRHGVGFLGVNLLLPTLTDAGHTDGAYYTITGTEFPSWGYSVMQGATTIWERWNSFTKANGFGDAGMNSFNHYAYGSCVEWLYRTVLGIDGNAGFGQIVIKPEPGPGVNSARGHYDSIRGRIATAWKLEGGQLALDVTLPANVTAEIHVPADSAGSITESGKPADTAPGLKFLRFENRVAVYAAGSGEYHFVATFAGPTVTVTPPVPGKSNAAQEERGPKLAPEAAGGSRYTVNTKIGVLLDDPAAKAALLTVIPEAINNPDFSQARESTFAQLVDFAPEYFTEQRVKEIGAVLAKIGQPKWSIETTIVGQLLANPDTKAVLQKHAPQAVNNPDFAQASSMTLREVAEFAADYFTAERLKAIEADLSALGGSTPAGGTPAPATPPAPPSTPKPPAPTSSVTPLGIESKIGDLLDDSAAKAVLATHLGGMIDAPQFAMARGITLKQLQPYLKDKLTDALLATIAGELAKLGTTKKSSAALSADSKMGELLANSDAKAMLAKHLPKLVASPQIDQSRELTLRDLKKYFPEQVTAEKLQAIEADLATIAGQKSRDAAAPVAALETWSVDTTTGMLMDNAGTMAVLMKHLPEVFGNPQIAAARQMSLRKLQPYVAQMTDAVLATMDRELHTIPVPPGTAVKIEPSATVDPLKLVTIPLWEKRAPGATGDRVVDTPSLTVVAPEPVQSNGTAIIVAPGGAYQGLALNHEGRQVADWFAAHGITAFVLRYRLVSSGYFHPTQLHDAQRAVRWVRAHAKEYHIDPERVGMIGFSAGGHLTTMVATQGDIGDANAEDPVDRMSSKLNFMVLAYPAVLGSANLTTILLNKTSDPATADFVNSEKYLTKETPPAFIFQTADDEVVPLDRVEKFSAALEKAGVPVEMHVYPHGEHGLGLALHDSSLREWPVLLEKWLDQRGLLGVRRP
jgi:alpha-L-rhamnosidase